MDFEHAANRLKKDHAELRNRARQRPQTLASKKATSEALKRQEYRKKQLEKRKEKERIEKLKFDYVRRGFDIVEQKLGVLRDLSDKESSAFNGNARNGVMLEATSVHGQGDKISLPPSLLSTLANRDLLRSSQERGQPLFFRLGIRRPNYVFPSSEKMKQFRDDFVVKDAQKFGSVGSVGGNDSVGTFDESLSMMDVFHDNEHEEDEENNQQKWEQAYLDELSHEYVSYVYATVVEFTQDEGCIGLPKCMATALLQPKLQSNTEAATLETKLTADPAASVTPDASAMDIDTDNDNANENANDNDNAEHIQTAQNNYNNNTDDDADLESKTPGHPAYGLFPIPKNPIEITLLTHLPLGKKCTLQPTTKAIKNGFYNLKDIKLALEQSLIRTRGCLNVNDIVYCWYRGKKYDLCVKDVLPSHVGAVSCVNTDVEVDIAAAESEDETDDCDDTRNEKKIVQDDNNLKGKHIISPTQSNNQQQTQPKSTGFRLSDDRPKTSSSHASSSSISVRHFYDALKATNLPEEPPIDQIENIISVQIRGDKGQGCRRRFDASSTQIGDLFVFAVHEQIVDESNNDSITDGFRLVTRFPRRVFTLETDGETLLANASLSKQEMFMIEKM